MKIVKTKNALSQALKQERENGARIGFVPTMGYLHEGHLSLVRRARGENDCVVMSIFVNPLQFGPNEDLDQYPRDFERDERLAEAEGVDYLFYPSVEEMYPSSMSLTLHVTEGVDVLCGASRPGHFDGVATVVLKLFNLIRPERAYFGMKDAQQVAVIMNMVQDLNVPIEIVPCPTIREEDGLAKSSRNVRLAPQEREEAKRLYQGLTRGQRLIERGELNVETIRSEIRSYLEANLSGKVDYVDVLSYPRLNKITMANETVILAVAYHYGDVRLIDNLVVTR